MPDLDQIRGGPRVIQHLVTTPGPDGRTFINRDNVSAFGVMDSPTRPVIRVVTTRTTDSRKDEFAEIFKMGYFRTAGQEHLLVMYDWNISPLTMSKVVAPIAHSLFGTVQGDILTSSLVEFVSSLEEITWTRRMLTFVQHLFRGNDPNMPVARNEISLHIALMSREEHEGKPRWRLRQTTHAIRDFHVSPMGELVVMSDEWAFAVDPKVLIRAVKGSGWRDEDFRAERGNGIRVGTNAVLTRYTPMGFPFNIAVYDEGALCVYDPFTGKVLHRAESNHLIMTAADGSGSLYAVGRTHTGRRKVRSHKTSDQDTVIHTPRQ